MQTFLEFHYNPRGFAFEIGKGIFTVYFIFSVFSEIPRCLNATANQLF